MSRPSVYTHSPVERKELDAFLNTCTELPEVGYGGYDWSLFQAFHHGPTGRFYWASGSGCSCNDLWDGFDSIGDMFNGTAVEVLAALKRFNARSDRYQFDDRAYQRLTRAIRDVLAGAA